jgi:signal transduction histidine kinase
LRRVPIRMKLAAALAVPLLALVVVTVVEMVKTSDEVGEIKAQTVLARITVGPTGLITALQNERSWAVVDLLGTQQQAAVPLPGYDETRQATDEAIERFRADVGDVGGAATEAYAPALDSLAELEQLRSDIDADTNVRDLGNIEFTNEVFTRYAELITPFLTSGSEVALSIDDPDLRVGVELVDTTSRQIEVLADLLRTALVTAVSDGGVDEPEEITELGRLLADFNRNATLIRSTGGHYESIIGDHYPEQLNEGVNEQIDAAIATSAVDVEALFEALNVPPEQNYPGLHDEISQALYQRAAEINDEANARDNWFIILAVLTLGLALVLTWRVSRSITQPLRALTRQAKEMAEQRLPDAVLDILETPLGENVKVPETQPVEVPTRDEVADVAVALNTVQDTALDLAVEQAVLRRNIADSFVNLGRRNQNLLGRQLDFITELESHETDPDTLASLFRLDHLATRMRRNAESLLVLAGIDPPRKWAAPVRLTDVIRAALGEVEDYQRVTIRDVEPTTILGSAAADLAHLIAEFIENALTFSPPDQNVDVRGHSQREGDGYSLTIDDSGLGMADADIAQANRRLAGTESFTIAPSKYLGHYVAGNLAARHGIHLELASSPGGGVTARIGVPAGLLTSDAPADDPITDPHGHKPVPGDVPLAEDVPAPALTALAPASAGPDGIAGALADLAQTVAAGRDAPWGGVAAPAANGGAPYGDPGTAPSPAPSPPGPLDVPAPLAASAGADLDAPPARRRPPAAAARHDAGTDGPSGIRSGRTGWLPAPEPALDRARSTGPVRRVPDEAETTRTASGLVKRTPLGADAPPAGPGADPRPGPSDDLLAALSRHADTLGKSGSHQAVGGTGVFDSPSPVQPAAVAGASVFDAPAPVPAPAPAPGSTVFDRAGDPGLTAPVPQVGADAEPAPAARGRFTLDPGPADAEPEPSGARGALRRRLGRDARPEPETPPAAHAPAAPAAPAPAPAPAAAPAPGTATTRSGLARRVRGSNMPDTNPLAVRRRDRGAGAGPVPDAPQHSPNDVYGFLTSFTSGVQKGLDDAAGGRGPV